MIVSRLSLKNWRNFRAIDVEMRERVFIVGAKESLLLETKREGTEVRQAASIKDVRVMLESGFSVGEAVMPKVTPPKVGELSLGLYFKTFN
jgi:hypothetical protein